MKVSSVNNNVSFKARLTPDYIAACKVLRTFKNQGIVSPTFEMYRHVRPNRLLKKLTPSTPNPKNFNSDFAFPDRDSVIRNMYYLNNPVLKNDKYYGKFLAFITKKTNNLELLRNMFKNSFNVIAKQQKLPQTEESANKLLSSAVADFKIANCKEQSLIMQNELEKLNIPSVVIGRELFDHCFIVANIAKNADISNPKTWGKKAFVVDAWMNKVFKSKEDAFTEYKRIFNNGYNFLRKLKIKNPQMELGQYIPSSGVNQYTGYACISKK